MKKLILLGLLLTLTSCSLFGKKTPTTFEEYYVRNVDATIDSITDASKSLGFFQSSQVSGILDGALSIPILLSGSMSSEYTVKTDGRDSLFDLDNGKMQYDSLAGSGFFSFDKISLMTESGDFYLLYKNLQDMGLSTAEMREIFKKFDNTWLSSTREESRASITDPTEIQAMTFIENLMKLDEEKIKKYLTTYPIWKSTEDMGMSGSLHVYKVALDREKAFGLLSTLKTDLTGSGYTETEQADIRTRLEEIDLSGSIAFHPEDTSIIDANITLTHTTVPVGAISVITDSSKTQIVFESIEEAIQVKYTYTDGESRDDMELIASQSGVELAQMDAYIDTTDNVFHELSVDITAQGITVSLKHTQGKDGVFDGQLLLPVGSVSWDGSVNNRKLTALKVQGASPVGAIELDLTASGEMIRGPFVLRTGGEEVMRALVGVLAEPERLRLSVDIPQSTEGSDMIHSEIGITMKRDTFSDQIEPPRSSTPLSELMNALESVMPSEFTEGSSLDAEESGMTLDEMDSFEPIQ